MHFDKPPPSPLFLSRGAQLKSHGGPEIFLLSRSRAKTYMFIHFKVCFQRICKLKSKSWALRARKKASTGHIWPAGRMLCMSVLESQVSFDQHHTKEWSHPLQSSNPCSVIVRICSSNSPTNKQNFFYFVAMNVLNFYQISIFKNKVFIIHCCL